VPLTVQHASSRLLPYGSQRSNGSGSCEPPGLDYGVADGLAARRESHICLDQPGTSGRIPERAPEVPSRLGVVVRTLPTLSGIACNRQPSESDVVHDHIRLGKGEIAAIACIVVGIGTRHMNHTGTTQTRETMGGSSSSRQFSSARGSTEMINDGCSYANRKVLIKGVGENLLPTAQRRRLGRPSPTVAAPGTRNGQIDLFCHLTPGQASVTQLHDLLCRRRVRRSAATHSNPGAAELVADRGHREAQLGGDLAQTPTLGIQLGCMLKVHCATVTSRSPTWAH
jgi:hypothetical protein